MSKISYEGIGEMVVTIGMTEEVKPGMVVRMLNNDLVCSCQNGDHFCGVARKADELYGSMQVKGFVKVPYTDEMGLGWMKLAANEQGGICIHEDGLPYLVVQMDEDEMTAVICL